MQHWLEIFDRLKKIGGCLVFLGIWKMAFGPAPSLMDMLVFFALLYHAGWIFYEAVWLLAGNDPQAPSKDGDRW